MSYTLSEWDNYDTTAQQYPLAEYEWIAVKDQTECDGIIASRVWSTGDMLVGEVRWFGPRNGVLIIKRSQKASTETVNLASAKIHSNALFFAILFVGICTLICTVISLCK
jgi:hypothetical protein